MAEAPNSVIDPMPPGHIGSDDAVRRLADVISDYEVEHDELVRRSRVETLARVGVIDAQLNSAELAWNKRHIAICRLYAAFCGDALESLERDPVSHKLLRLTASVWHGHAGWYDTVLGGVIRASIGEEIERYNGRRVLLQASAFEGWLKQLVQTQAQPEREVSHVEEVAVTEREPRTKKDRLNLVTASLRDEGKLRPGMEPRDVRKAVLGPYRDRWKVKKGSKDDPSPRTVQRAYAKLFPMK
jgi:hypothetical protein